VGFLRRIQIAVTVCAVAAGCVSQPIGPAVAVKPGHDKPFTVFLQDDAQCKQYAREHSRAACATERAAKIRSLVPGMYAGQRK
jgi:hypothetical protein